MELDVTAPADRDASRPATAGGRRFDVDRLVHEIQSGRSIEENFGEICRRYAAPVTHFFINHGLKVDQAEDLVQEAFFRVYKNIGEFRRQASFETWLFRIAGNVWKNALRHRRSLKRAAEEVSLETLSPDNPSEPMEGARWEPADSQDGPLDQVLADERSTLLDEALAGLPPKMKQCVLLRLGQDLKYREIAAVMQVSIASVKSQLNAARHKLKPLLDARGVSL